VSRKWSGKTLVDHEADRKAFVKQALAVVGIEKPEPDTSRLLWRKVESNDPSVPRRDQLITRAIAERITWKAEYDRGLLAAAGPLAVFRKLRQVRLRPDKGEKKWRFVYSADSGTPPKNWGFCWA